MGLHDYTFYDLISRNAVSFSSLAAWFDVDDQRTLTYAELKQKELLRVRRALPQKTGDGGGR